MVFTLANALVSGTILVVIFAAIALSIGLVLWLFGKVMKDEVMQAKGKDEVGQAVYSILLFIVILFVVNLLLGIMPTIVETVDPYATTDSPFMGYVGPDVSERDIGVAWDSSNDKCYYHSGTHEYEAHVCVAMSYIDRTSWLIERTMLYLTNFRQFLGILQSLSLDFKISSLGIKTEPFNGLEFQENMVDLAPGFLNKGLYDTLSKGLLIYKMLEFSLNILSQLLFPALLVGGMVLRSFYFTRKLGGLLVASALALYFVGPAVMMIGHKAIFESNNFIAMHESVTGGEVVPYFHRLDDETLTHSAGSAGAIDEVNPTNDPDYDYTDDITNVTMLKQTANYYMKTGNNYLRYIFFEPEGDLLMRENGIVHMFAKIIVLTVMVLFLALMSVIAVIRSFGALIGGDTQIAGLAHFI